MNCLAFVPTKNGQATKAGLEAVSYATRCGATVTALVVGALEGDGGIGAAGAAKVLHMNEGLQDEGQIARVVSAAADAEGATLVVAPTTTLAVRWLHARQCAWVRAWCQVQRTDQGSEVKKNVFSGKAMAHVNMDTEKTVVTTTPNAFGVTGGGSAASVEPFTADAGEARIAVKGLKRPARMAQCRCQKPCAWCLRGAASRA